MARTPVIKGSLICERVSGLGRELEKLAIDSMAIAALARIRARAKALGCREMLGQTRPRPVVCLSPNTELRQNREAESNRDAATPGC